MRLAMRVALCSRGASRVSYTRLVWRCTPPAQTHNLRLDFLAIECRLLIVAHASTGANWVQCAGDDNHFLQRLHSAHIRACDNEWVDGTMGKLRAKVWSAANPSGNFVLLLLKVLP